MVSSDLYRKITISFKDKKWKKNVHIKIVAGEKELEELLKDEEKRVTNKANIDELIKQAHEIGSKPVVHDEE
ncbi:MAG: hypothetical protein D6820_04575 [Lentisphaerae bacterium]|nr:MAG: hypothetical protein D6820_04575 [Lentisphaerota bacterium]